jgi:hypothetical protein
VTHSVGTDAQPANRPPQSVIDLTNDSGDSEELQRAIAASLQDSQGILGGQISREDQDISRCVAECLDSAGFTSIWHISIGILHLALLTGWCT